MTLVVPKYRVYDDTDSQQPNQALLLMKTPEVNYSIFWDLLPFRSPVRQLKYDMASRSITPRSVVLQNNIETSDTDIDLSAATKARATASHVLYHPATQQRFVLDDMNQTTGTANIRSVVQAHGGSRTLIAAGQTLYILAASELFDEINAESRFEDTDIVTNYVQDVTELLKFSTADLREIRKWGVDKKMRLKERMRDIMKDLNQSLIYNAPLEHSAGVSSMTAGFDYLVRKANNVVDAATSGTADLADIRGVLRTLVANGAGPGDGIIIHMSASAYFEYESNGLQDINLQGTPEQDFVIGNTVKGMHFSGLGFVPFYPDHTIVDDSVRFVATAHAGKALYQGLGEGSVLESLRLVDEPSMGDSKNDVSSLQMKFGTIFENTDKVHYILANTGL